ILVEYPQIGRWNSNSLERHAGFSGAVVWKVETDVGPVALRKWPSGWNSTRLAGLHRLLEFLHRKELEIVAAPWRTRAGHTLLVCNRHLFQVEPWLPGVADFRKSPTETRLTAAMTALARWHIQAARFQPA